MAHKVIETLRYTEVVYYDDSGAEVHRERNHDDSLWDDSEPIELTDEERGGLPVTARALPVAVGAALVVAVALPVLWLAGVLR